MRQGERRWKWCNECETVKDGERDGEWERKGREREGERGWSAREKKFKAAHNFWEGKASWRQLVYRLWKESNKEVNDFLLIYNWEIRRQRILRAEFPFNPLYQLPASTFNCYWYYHYYHVFPLLHYYYCFVHPFPYLPSSLSLLHSSLPLPLLPLSTLLSLGLSSSFSHAIYFTISPHHFRPLVPPPPPFLTSSTPLPPFLQFPLSPIRRASVFFFFPVCRLSFFSPLFFPTFANGKLKRQLETLISSCNLSRSFLFLLFFHLSSVPKFYHRVNFSECHLSSISLHLSLFLSVTNFCASVAGACVCVFLPLSPRLVSLLRCSLFSLPFVAPWHPSPSIFRPHVPILSLSLSVLAIFHPHSIISLYIF